MHSVRVNPSEKFALYRCQVSTGQDDLDPMGGLD